MATLTIEQAATAIVHLINERPVSPRKDEVEAIIARAVGSSVWPATTPISDLESRLLQAIGESHAAEKAIDDGRFTDEDAADARFLGALKRVDQLAAQLPDPPRSLTQIVLRAKVAFAHADKAGGKLAALSSGEAGADEVAAARLIDAVLQSAGIDAVLQSP